MSTPAEHVKAQDGAWNYDKGTKSERWWQHHLVGPRMLNALIEDSALLDRIRALFLRSAEWDMWTPGTTLDEAVVKLIKERDELRARVAALPPMTTDTMSPAGADYESMPIL